MRHRNAKKLAPIHPGTILREDLEDVGVSINQLGRELRVPVNRISAIVNGQRGITADTALRLAQYFGNSPQYWMNLQALYDLEAVDPAKRVEIQQAVRCLPIGLKTQYWQESTSDNTYYVNFEREPKSPPGESVRTAVKKRRRKKEARPTKPLEPGLGKKT